MFEKQTEKNNSWSYLATQLRPTTIVAHRSKALLTLSIDERKNLGSTGDVISENSFYC